MVSPTSRKIPDQTQPAANGPPNPQGPPSGKKISWKQLICWIEQQHGITSMAMQCTGS
ncbi:MAG: hypothetical protein JWN04_3237 [Myxococcaceae bacterium]|nr:hypothetical protein [Myxococcaceae bacterium]